MRKYPLATLIGLVLVFLFVVFFGRSVDRYLPLIAAGVLMVLVNVVSGSLAMAWNTQRLRLERGEALSETRADIMRVFSNPEDPELRSVLRNRDAMDIYHAGLQFPPAEQEALRGLMKGTGLDRAAVRRAASEPGKWERVTALRMLGWLRSDVAVQLLAVELRSSDADIRLAAAEALASINAASAYETLFGAFKQDLLRPSRIATFLESSAYVDRIRELSLHAGDEVAEVRFWVAYLLGRTNDVAALPALERLARDPNLDVRASAAEALAPFSALEETREILETLLRDPEWPVRSHAAKAVSTGGEVYAEHLAPLLFDHVWWVRQNAASALERIGTTAIPLLLQVLESDDRFARNKAAEALVRLGFVNTLVGRLLDEDQSDQSARTLVKLAEAGATGRVGEAVAEASVDAQLQVMNAMPSPAPAELAPVLTRLAASSSRLVVRAAERLGATVPA